MKSLRLISSLSLISLGIIIFIFTACETNQETVKTTSVKSNINTKVYPKPEFEKPVNIHIIKSDSTIVPDTIETHDTQQQKKSAVRIVRKILNFHKKPLIT